GDRLDAGAPNVGCPESLHDAVEVLPKIHGSQEGGLQVLGAPSVQDLGILRTPGGALHGPEGGAQKETDGIAAASGLGLLGGLVGPKNGDEGGGLRAGGGDTILRRSSLQADRLQLLGGDALAEGVADVVAERALNVGDGVGGDAGGQVHRSDGPAVLPGSACPVGSR